MDQSDVNEKVRQLTEENARLKATLQEIHATVISVLGERKPTMSRSFEQQLLHDLRNILNELNLLRALVPDDESDK